MVESKIVDRLSMRNVEIPITLDVASIIKKLF